MFSVKAKPTPTIPAYTRPSMMPSNSLRRISASRRITAPFANSSTGGATNTADRKPPLPVSSSSIDTLVLMKSATRVAMKAPQQSANRMYLVGSGS
jgi:hypothetical protein